MAPTSPAPKPSHYRALALILTAAVAIGLARTIPRASYAGTAGSAVPDRDAATISPPPTPRPRVIDPNTASLNELIALPFIGPAMARRILAARTEPFRRPEDLLRVRGIGPRTLDRLRPFLVFGDAGATDPASSADRPDPTGDRRPLPGSR